MIAGNLLDVAFPELLQFLHLSGRSGTLYLEREEESAYISFHQGRIASAWLPGSMTVVDYLQEIGRLSTEAIERAHAVHEGETVKRSLGEILLSIGAITPEDLRDAVGRKIERAVFELVGWRRGSFRFELEEVRYDEELLFVPSELAPRVDLDTQVVLMEALRLFDGRPRESRPSLAAEARRAVAAAAARAEPAPAPVVAPAGKASRIDVVTRDRALFEALSAALGAEIPVEVAGWQDAGATTDRGAALLVVCDLRGDALADDRVARLHRDRPRCAIVAVIDAALSSAAAYASGAASVAPPEPAAIAACCQSLLQAMPSAPGVPNAGLARVREFLRSLRTGLASTALSTNLMAMIAQFADRAVLFAVRRDTLVSLTAFGRTNDAVLLADATRKLNLVFEEGGSFELCFRGGHALRLEWDHDDIPEGLRMVLGRPTAGEGVLFPVMGARRPIAVIYADNGDRAESIADIEIMELATGHFGLAIENESLRRHLERKA